MKSDLIIRKAQPQDKSSIWKIIQPIIERGDTYTFHPQSTEKDMISYWCNVDKNTYVACLQEKVVGTFIIKDNLPGLGSHVANASYMVSEEEAGRGVGSAMCEFSLEEAKLLGYKAMQFNVVVKSNERAIRLWQKFGFEIIGEIPNAFNHLKNGLTNGLIMWRSLR